MRRDAHMQLPPIVKEVLRPTSALAGQLMPTSAPGPFAYQMVLFTSLHKHYREECGLGITPPGYRKILRQTCPITDQPE